MRLGRWLGLLLGLASLAPLAAVAGDVTIGANGSYGLSEGFSYLEDRDQTLTFEQVLEPAQQARFQPLPAGGSGANFGFNWSALWLRFPSCCRPVIVMANVLSCKAGIAPWTYQAKWSW